uniref:Uncharacterized protein n=1 Tax=Entomoneis paludosa TaxID=265537 RepID=A0A7S2Y3W3_9STRA|mmetsp:Transcript_1351/g.2959  ORF Transcript_1351/g.2959 Transcript_1351/m.2959 type:complete len:436 (+) Transcript_1351:228-1535(+)
MAGHTSSSYRNQKHSAKNGGLNRKRRQPGIQIKGNHIKFCCQALFFACAGLLSGSIFLQADLPASPPLITPSTPTTQKNLAIQVPKEIRDKKCAIILFGLPRAFRRLVLPSLRQHVIRINAEKYKCDWYAHWYNDTREMPSRSGQGGELDSIPTLKQALEKTILHYHHHDPRIQFTTDSNTTFWESYGPLIQKILTEKGQRKFRKEHAVDPRLLYWPVKDISYNAQTLINIVKMWHSIQSAYQLAMQSGIPYDRVAVLRSDVMFLTPIDIWSRVPTNQTTTNSSAATIYDLHNEYAVVPGGFGMYPINDRFIYGPAKAVQTWATQRFSLLEEHVHETILKKEPGFGMHNERFLFHSIFPRIEKLEYDMKLCLVRVRADSSVWINDCGNLNDNVQIIEHDILQGQTCQRPLRKLDPKFRMSHVRQLLCDNVAISTP